MLLFAIFMFYNIIKYGVFPINENRLHILMLIIIIIKVKYSYYSEIITIQLTSYVNLKPVNWNFVNNRLTVRLTGFSSQP